MYQWKETKEQEINTNLGGGETKVTTYSYEKVWSESLISSDSFKYRQGHENPQTSSYKSATFTAQNIKLGAYRLTKPFVDQLGRFESYPLTEANAAAMSPALRKSFSLAGRQYITGNPSNPQIGALRITYGIIKPGEMSIVGKQDGAAVVPFETNHGSIKLIEQGILSSDSMFKEAEKENSRITWLWRLGAFMLIWLGLALILRPLKVLADVVPFLGGIVGAGIGLISGLGAMIATLIAIASAWLIVRPLIGVALLVAAIVLVYGGYSKIRGSVATMLKRKAFR